MLSRRIATDESVPAKRDAKMDQHRRPCVALWSFVAACYGVLLVLIAGHFRPGLDVHLSGYKVGHAVAFAGLGLLIACYFRREFEFSIVLGVTLTLLACAFFGALIELYQCLLPGRSPELRDIALDSMGALAGALAYVGYQIAAGNSPRTTVRQGDGAGTARRIHYAKPGQIITFPLKFRYVPLEKNVWVHSMEARCTRAVEPRRTTNSKGLGNKP